MKKLLIKDGVILFLGTAVNTIIMLLMQVILARNLGLDEYGAVISAFNLVNFLSLFISFGASEYILKSFGKYGGSAYKVVQVWIKLIPISVVILIIVVIFTFTSNIFGDLTSAFLLIIIPNIVLQGLLPLTLSVYQIEGNYKKTVVINLVLYSVRLLAASVALFVNESIYLIGYMMSVFSIIGLLYYFTHLKRFFLENLQIPVGDFSVLEEKSIVKSTLKGTIPYALLTFFYYGFSNSNIIFINIFLDETSVALYNAAFTIISLTFILPMIVMRQLFNPKLYFWIKNDVQKVIILFLKGSKWMVLLGLLIAVILLPLSKFIIHLLFGAKFSDAATILILLLIIIPIRYIQAVSDAIMNTENQIYIKNRIYFIVFIISLLLNLILIPKMELTGVILTTIFSEVLLCILTFIYCWKFIKSKMVTGEMR